MNFLVYLVCYFCVFTTVDAQTVSKSVHFQITGTTNIIKTSILRHLNTLDQKSFQQDERTLNAQLLRSKKSVHSILQAQGYFKPHIQVNVDKRKECIRIHYDITPGPQLLISKIHIDLLGEGKDDPQLKVLVHALLEKIHHPMSTENYQLLKRNLYKGIIAQGYIDAQWQKNVVDIDLEHYSSTVTLVIDTKKQYTVDSIKFSKTPIDEQYLRKALPYETGAPYRMQDIFQAETHLKNLGYFKEVLTQFPTTLPSSKVPVTIHVTPAAPFYHKLGLKITTELNFALEGELMARYLNRKGHQAGVMGHLSTTNQKIIGLYTIPNFQPNAQSYHVQGVVARQLLNGLNTHYQQLTLNVAQLYSTVHVNRFIRGHREYSSQNERGSYFLIGGLSLEHTKLQWFQARHNYKFYLSSQGALKALFSKTSFLKSELHTDYFAYFSLLQKPNYLIFRTRLGYLHTPSIEQIPPSLNFYAGGEAYPRGYSKYKLAKHLITFSAEYRYPLLGAFYLAPFIDSSYTDQLAFPAFKTSTGISLLLWVPTVGQIEISWVKKWHDLDDSSSNSHWVGRVSMKDL